MEIYKCYGNNILWYKTTGQKHFFFFRKSKRELWKRLWANSLFNKADNVQYYIKQSYEQILP